jgi:hypothetical protein
MVRIQDRSVWLAISIGVNYVDDFFHDRISIIDYSEKIPTANWSFASGLNLTC